MPIAFDAGAPCPGTKCKPSESSQHPAPPVETRIDPGLLEIPRQRHLGHGVPRRAATTRLAAAEFGVSAMEMTHSGPTRAADKDEDSSGAAEPERLSPPPGSREALRGDGDARGHSEGRVRFVRA